MLGDCCSEPVSYVAVEEDCTGGLIVEVFDDLDKVSLISHPSKVMLKIILGRLKL